jgi:integrase/recombinase XerD
MTRDSARRVVERIAKRAGVKNHIYPHALRAAYVTNMLDAGVPIRDVQIGAGHSDPRVTMKYDRARANLDRSGNYVLASYLAGSS